MQCTYCKSPCFVSRKVFLCFSSSITSPNSLCCKHLLDSLKLCFQCNIILRSWKSANLFCNEEFTTEKTVKIYSYGKRWFTLHEIQMEHFLPVGGWCQGKDMQERKQIQTKTQLIWLLRWTSICSSYASMWGLSDACPHFMPMLSLSLLFLCYVPSCLNTHGLRFHFCNTDNVFWRHTLRVTKVNLGVDTGPCQMHFAIEKPSTRCVYATISQGSG